MAELLARRALLRAAARSPLALLLPPLEIFFDGRGVAHADGKPIERRFVLWFNGNGVPEKYWMPRETGPGFGLSPCLAPLAPHRDDVVVVTGLDNLAAMARGLGNGHTNSMSALVSGKPYTGRGAGGPSVDQLVAGRIGAQSRFRSLQIGVASESFGTSMQRNLSWAAQDRPLAPELLPHRLFDRLFGRRELGWIDRKKSVLDAVLDDAEALRGRLGGGDRARVEEHLASVRELERTIASLPPEAAGVTRPDEDGDMRDWPRIAKLQSELLVQALATGQTRVASYMLTKCQSLTRFPWLGHTVLRHHDYTHYDRVPGTSMPAQLALRDICRWKVEELAYLLGRLASIREGDGTLLDHTCVLFAHEHAEGNDHKNSGLGIVLAGCRDRLRTGEHVRVAGSLGDLYVTIADEVIGADLRAFPTASRRLGEILRA